MRFDRILVPLDGTPAATVALPYAQAIAARTGATLILMRAAHAPVGAFDLAAAQQQAVDVAQADLEAQSALLVESGLRVEVAVPYGSAVAWIPEEAALRHADMVVMATHARTGPERWIHGSVAEAVAARSPVPLLVVRAADGVQPARRLTMRCPLFVVPLDGSSFGEAALPVAASIADAFNGRLLLVGVAAQRDPETRRYLDRILASLPAGLVAGSVLRVGDPASEIALEAHQSGAATVVMATHGRTGLTRSVLGSVAGEVVQRAIAPVLLVHPLRRGAAHEPAISVAHANLASAST